MGRLVIVGGRAIATGRTRRPWLRDRERRFAYPRVAKHGAVYNRLAESCEVSVRVIAKDPSAAPE